MSLQDLVTRLSPRFDKLSALCDEIGLPSQQKDEHQLAIINAIETQVDQSIDNLSEELATLKKDLSQIQEDMAIYKQKMSDLEIGDTVVTSRKSLRAVMSDLRAQFKEVHKQYQERRAIVKELCERLQLYSRALSMVMDVNLVTNENADISLPMLDALKEEVRRCEHEYNQRVERIEAGTAHIVSAWTILGISPEHEKDTALRRLHEEQDETKKQTLCIPWMSDDGLAHITHRISQLEELRQQREFQKEEILQDLNRLWNGLRVNQEERNVFKQQNCHLKLKDIENYAAERARLQQLKKDRIADFITASRKELASLWDKLYFSEEERRSFRPAFEDEMSETVLNIHENEIKRLLQLVEIQRPVLEAVENHMNLHKEIMEFEDTTNDPGRLFGKGQRDPGRLLREEKFRKKISRELPKMERALRKLLQEYYVKTGRPFLVKGVPYANNLPPEKILKPSKSQNSLSASIPVTPSKLCDSATKIAEPSPTNVAGRQLLDVKPSKIPAPSRRVAATDTSRKAGLSVENSLHRVRHKAITKPKETTAGPHSQQNRLNLSQEQKPLPGTLHMPFKKTG